MTLFKKIIIFVAVLAIILIAGGSYLFIQQRNSAQDADDQAAVRSVVTAFGKKLQNVPLLASSEILNRTMEESYGDVVSSPAVIKSWVEVAAKDPQSAPGRLTSSPWPDRIEISSIEKTSKTSYSVKGDIIEITSVEAGEGGIAAKRPVTISAEKSDVFNKWLISSVDFSQYAGASKVSPRDKAVQEYLLTQDHFVWRTRGDSHRFCEFENLNPEKELFPIYAWVYCGEYIIENGNLKTLSGSSGPAMINYPNELSFYDPYRFSYQIPGDGKQYGDDIKKIFPANIQEKILNFDSSGLAKKVEDLAFNNIKAWEEIKQAVNNCQIKSALEESDRNVAVELKSGKELTAIEPSLGGLMAVASVVNTKCGFFNIATE